MAVYSARKAYARKRQHKRQHPRVPSVKAEQMECGAPFFAVSPRLHGIRGPNRALHAHCEKHGEIAHGRAKLLKKARVLVSEHFLGVPYLPRVLFKFRNEA